MSASTMPTLYPCAASATARFVVTLDLPTPPFPDDTKIGRVFEPGFAKEISRPDACPCAGCDPAVAPGLPCNISRTFARSSSVITPKLRATSCTPSNARSAVPTRF